MMDNLIKSLNRNQTFIESFKDLTIPMRDVTAYLQREEILVLSCLNKVFRYHDIPKVSLILDVFKYQLSTNFKGLRLRPQDMYTEQILLSQQHMITTLALQLVFNLFQVHEVTSSEEIEKSDKMKKFVTSLVTGDFKELSKVIGEIGQPMDGVTSIIYLTFR